jgi:hypothetical protein
MNKSRTVSLVFLVLIAASATNAAPPSPFAPGKHGPASLEFVAGMPVLTVSGSPAEMGEQAGALIGSALRPLLARQQEIFAGFGLRQPPGVLLGVGKALQTRFPVEQREELKALCAAAEVDYAWLAFGNVMYDWAQQGCSALLVEPSRSTTGGVLFGRNLDLPTFGFLHRYSLVTVYRPTGKHAFVGVAMPGLIGCVSGMNDAGLCVAELDARSNKDGSTTFDFAGAPLAMCFRRVLEECSTVDEAAALLRSQRRTTACNLSVCDLRQVGVLELTPKSVVLRKGTHGWCACTNHFRSSELSVTKACWRYDKLAGDFAPPRLGLKEIAAAMQAVNQGERTLQTMIFEPAQLRLHLSLGAGPTSARPLKPLELAARFKPAEVQANAAAAAAVDLPSASE